jgi:leader peptidase (prepilin peptidase)/N-methyltransferase
MEYAAFFYAAVFLCGLLAGSFLNMRVLRRTGEKSEARFPPASLLPASFRLIEAKLRRRKSERADKMLWQSALLETGNALLWLAAVYYCGWTLVLPLNCAFISALLALAVVDGKSGKIPPSFNIFILIIGVLRIMLAVLSDEAVSPFIAGFFAVSLPLYFLYLFSGGRAIGGGDIKLTAVAGLFLGWQIIIAALFIACVSASLIHLLRMKIKGAGSYLALGPYLAAGCMGAMFFAPALIRWYTLILKTPLF